MFRDMNNCVMCCALWLCVCIGQLHGDTDRAASSCEGVRILKAIMSKDQAARLEQYAVKQNVVEKGVFHWNCRKKVVRIEMDCDVLYLYTAGGLHIKEVDKVWVHVPLPEQWLRVLWDADAVLRDSQATIDEVRPGAYGLRVSRDGQFVHVFWSRESLTGWVMGTVNPQTGSDEPEIAINLEPMAAEALPDHMWRPESSFSE